MTDKQRKLAEKILGVLERQRFNDWYNRGKFDDYITVAFPKDHPEHVSKEMILQDIVQMFGMCDPL